jgi:hypothetical protein
VDHRSINRCSWTDPKSVLLPPHKIIDVSAPLANKVAISLATRYGITVAAARKYVPSQLSQWGKVSRLEGGDTIHTRDLIRLSDKDRDASYVRVRLAIVLLHCICAR